MYFASNTICGVFFNRAGTVAVLFTTTFNLPPVFTPRSDSVSPDVSRATRRSAFRRVAFERIPRADENASNVPRKPGRERARGVVDPRPDRAVALHSSPDSRDPGGPTRSKSKTRGKRNASETPRRARIETAKRKRGVSEGAKRSLLRLAVPIVVPPPPPRKFRPSPLSIFPYLFGLLPDLHSRRSFEFLVDRVRRESVGSDGRYFLHSYWHPRALRVSEVSWIDARLSIGNGEKRR